MEPVCDDVQELVCPVLMKKKINNDNSNYLLTRMHSLLEILCLTVSTEIKALCDVLFDGHKKVLICSKAGAITCGDPV